MLPQHVSARLCQESMTLPHVLHDAAGMQFCAFSEDCMFGWFSGSPVVFCWQQQPDQGIGLIVAMDWLRGNACKSSLSPKTAFWLLM